MTTHLLTFDRKATFCGVVHFRGRPQKDHTFAEWLEFCHAEDACDACAKEAERDVPDVPWPSSPKGEHPARTAFIAEVAGRMLPAIYAADARGDAMSTVGVSSVGALVDSQIEYAIRWATELANALERR